MLKKKSSEELTQKLVCYGTILLCLLYMIKFLKRYLSFRKSSSQQEPRPIMRQSCLVINPTQSHVKPRRQRHKRRCHTMAEQWLPRDDINHDHEFEEQCDYVATDHYPEQKAQEKNAGNASGSNLARV